MNKLKHLISILFLALLPFTTAYTAQALAPSVVISQLQTGGSGTGTAGQEFVELYNNGTSDIDVTDWCVTYSSAADGSSSIIGCVNAPDSATKVWLHANAYVTFVSPDFKAATGFSGDGLFNYTGGISGTAGHVRLLDSGKNEVDKVAWGSAAVHPEGTPASAPAGGKVLQRKSLSASVLQDTGNNSADFSVANSTLHSSGLYEVVTDLCPNIDGVQATVPNGMNIDAVGNCVTPPPPDLCPNVAGLQTTVPTGDLVDSSGDCQVDVCTNLDGLQLMVPDGYDLITGSCVLHDECANISGAQAVIPDGYIRSGTADCTLDLLPLQITELLPNASGSDTGNEFIELYNPTDRSADLSHYVLSTGLNNEKSYQFTAESTLQPGEYKAFYNGDVPFTLVNTTSRAALMGSDGTLVSETDPYAAPGDGMAWALVDGAWQYTDQPTPSAANLPSLPDDLADSSDTGSDLAPCPAGKYRNPLTNRCRTIESDAAILASCDTDQYRNPETGRCRKIVTADTQTPCKDGQYRSEETNRCRNIATASSELTPCKPGQERNPATNRCRNATNSVPSAGFAVEPVKQTASAFIGWWALGGIGLLAVGYAGWEWRHELTNIIRAQLFRK